MRSRLAGVFLMIGCVLSLPLPLCGQAFTRVTDAGALVRPNTSAWSSSWGDVNSDGFMDLFVISRPNELHLNNGDGTFTRVTSGHAVTFQGNQNSALWIDYDNDGHLDLYVSHLGPGTPIPRGAPLNPRVNFLYRNSGPPTYTLAPVQDDALTTTLNMTWTSSWSDYDNDGDLDLFVGGDQGDVDLFYENDGAGSFAQITNALFINPGEFSAGGSWLDLDGDGDEDLFVVNFMRTNNELYRNLLKETGSVSFERITTGSIVTDLEDDLVPSWGDYDNDGDLDAFMAVWNNRNNVLFRNEGDLTFTRVFNGIVVNDQGWSLGSAWLDYDNDGDLDLFVVDAQSFDRLYRNEGDGTFTRLFGSDAGPIVTTHFNSASGASVADYDNDGDLDVFVPTSGGGHLLYRNEVGADNHWLHVTPVGTTSNRAGVGAKVRLKASITGEPVWRVRYVTGNPSGDRAQSSMRAHFGLGDATLVDSLVIEWPSGIIDVYENIPVNQLLVVTEGQAASPVATQDETPRSNGFDLEQNYPNPFTGGTAMTYSLPKAALVSLKVYDLLGREIAVLVEARQPAGRYEVLFEAGDLPGGVYLYRLQADQWRQARLFTVLH